jgi:hypothetical protein
MKLAHVPSVMAVLAALALAASGFGARFGIWDFRFGFQLLRWSFYAGLAVAALALIMLIVPRLRSGRAASLAVALIIGLAVAYFPWHWQREARALPPINDITTDTANPPAFVAVIPLREGSQVPTTYPGAETAAKQQTAYPDIRPLDLKMPPDTAFARALDAAKSFGWQIDGTDAASGRIEATATTPWFGFSRRCRDPRDAPGRWQPRRRSLAVPCRQRRSRRQREARPGLSREAVGMKSFTPFPFLLVRGKRCATTR